MKRKLLYIFTIILVGLIILYHLIIINNDDKEYKKDSDNRSCEVLQVMFDDVTVSEFSTNKEWRLIFDEYNENGLIDSQVLLEASELDYESEAMITILIKQFEGNLHFHIIGIDNGVSYYKEINREIEIEKSQIRNSYYKEMVEEMSANEYIILEANYFDNSKINERYTNSYTFRIVFTNK